MEKLILSLQAWQAVLPAVEQLKEFYDFSQELEQCFPKLLTALCQDDPKTNLEKRQALAKQFADVFDFVLRFDDLKMLNPAIQVCVPLALDLLAS